MTDLGLGVMISHDLVMCLHFPTNCDISGSIALSHFPWLLLNFILFPPRSLYFFLVSSIMVIYIVLPLLLKSEVKFSGF